MAGVIAVELVSPDRVEYESDAEMIAVPGTEGDFAVLPYHAPLISTLRAGKVYITQLGGAVKELFVSDGFAEVTPERCTILSEFIRDMATVSVNEVDETIASLESDIKFSNEEQAAKQAEKQLSFFKSLRERL